MAYVPPHLRNRQNGASTAKPEKPPGHEDDEILVSPDEVKNHFWPVNDSSGAFASTSNSRTLHDSAARPGQLSYLFLFKGANPRWDADQIVYTKSSLEMLPPATDDGKPTPVSSQAANEDTTTAGEAQKATSKDEDEEVAPDAQPATPVTPLSTSNGAEKSQKPAQHVHNGDASSPVAVFKQVKNRQEGRSFAFAGWYHIHRITYLEPQSPDLVRMLEQKWSRTDRRGQVVRRERDQAAWQQSLSLRWAVVKFATHEEAERAGPPLIERLPDPGEEETRRRDSRKKSVNEMLEEMRMEDGMAKVEVGSAVTE